MPSKQTAYAELDQLEQRLAAARLAEREAEVTLAAAEASIETCRDAVREAHDLNANPAKPTKDLERAKQNAEQAALAAEGIGQRVKRASADREAFLADSGERLLDELEPACDEVVEQMRQHAEALLADHARWGALSARVAGYLRAMNLSPADNSRGEHELAGVVRDLKRALTREISSPAPHWSAHRAATEEHERKSSLRDQRRQVA